MSDQTTVKRDYMLPNLVTDQEKIKEHIDSLYAQIEKIRSIENRHLDNLIEELNTLTSPETADFVNTGANDANAPFEVVRFEQWQRTLIDETIQLECHFRSLKTKQPDFHTRMLPNLDRLDNNNRIIAFATRPRPPKDGSFYAMIKQWLFG